MHRNPDLIVPIRDRRQHKRYLTLKNFILASLALFVAFVAISIYSEVRRPAANDYGRLVKRQIVPARIEPKPVEVVTEETPGIEEQAAADPMLLEPMERAEWLGDEPAVIDAAPVKVSSLAPGERVAIVGGPEGVQIVKQTRRRQILSGGFGR